MINELEKLYNHRPRDAVKKRVPRTFKLKRAELNHLQTLREISAQQQQQQGRGGTKETQKTAEPTPGTSTQKD